MTTPPSNAPDGTNGTGQGSWLERVLVTFFLLALIALPAASTVARRLFDRDLPVAGPLAQNITLWVGFLGALLATSTGRHLALAAVENFAPGPRRRAVVFYGSAVSAAICAILAFGSYRFLQTQWGGLSEIGLGIRTSWSELVMPIGFAIMALRFAWRADGGGARSLWLKAAALAIVAAAFLLGRVTPGAGLTTLLIVAVLAAFLMGAPVFVVMAGIAMALFFRDGTGLAAVPNEVFGLSTLPTLPAIPLLTVAGYVLAEGGAARRLVRAYKGLFGWMPGGVAVMATVVCALFTTLTGASGVTILALGGLLLPTLLEDKYPEDFSVGLVTAAGSLGLLFPPSLPVFLYSVVAETPVKHLFIGGLLPGLLMIVLVAAYGVRTGLRAGAPRQAFHAGEALRALWDSKWDLGLPTLVVVAVASGYATIVEAAALAAAYSLAVELLVFRSIHPTRDLPRVMVHTSALVGSVLILLGAAYGLKGWFVDAELPTQLVAWMQVHVHSQALFLLMLNAVLLVLGSVLEMYSAIVVLAPLVAPLGAAYGVDPVHLGVVFLANLELGFLFPPMGLNLFLSASRFGKPLPWVYRKAFPFLLIMSIGVLAITYLPALTTGMVSLLTGGR